MNLSFAATLASRDFDVEFDLAAGATLAVVGPNGAGKSTLLAMLAGLLRPDTGRITLGDRTLTACGSPAVTVPPHARGVGLLAQEPLLFPHLSALDNVAFAPRSAGAGRRESRELAQVWLEELGVADLAGRRPLQLSGGQAQRVAIARALASDPALLLLDEPLAALDVDVTPAIRHALRRLLATRTTVVVTHSVLDAVLLADRVLVLEQGRVTEHDTATEVLSRPRSAFAARFAGLNLVHGRWRDGALHSPDGSVVHVQPGTTMADDVDAVAVFRPGAVAVHEHLVGGSPRNALPVVLTSVEPYGDLVRVRAGALSADVTAGSAAGLHLEPGAAVVFTVKATEVAAYPW